MEATIPTGIGSTASDTSRSKTIDVRERQDLWYWSRELGLSIEQLQHVVEATGPSVDDIRDFLRCAQQTPARAA